MTYLMIGLVLFALASAGAATYYRLRWSSQSKDLDAAVLARNAWAAQTTAMRDQVIRAERALAARQAKDAKADEALAARARTDASIAAGLLNELGATQPAREPPVPPGPGAGVPSGGRPTNS